MLGNNPYQSGFFQPMFNQANTAWYQKPNIYLGQTQMRSQGLVKYLKSKHCKTFWGIFTQLTVCNS